MVLRPPISLTFVKLKCLTFPPTSGKQKPTTMKKSMLFGAMAIMTMGAFAQEGLTSKMGEKYLPESGDWAVGIEASPFLDYAGNFFGKTGPNVSPTWMAANPMALTAKMFKDDKTAYRAIIGLNFGSDKASNLVYDDQPGVSTPDASKRVTDECKVSYKSITLGAGMEMRKGSTRLQGYYGGMGMITLGGGSKATYTYGNKMDFTTNPNPTTTTWTAIPGTTPVATGSAAAGSRTTESKGGGQFGLDLVGFIGAEYFILPKISFGAEYRWGLGFSSTGEGETTTEKMNAQGTAIETATTKTGKSGSFGLGNSIGYAALTLNLHFQ